MTMYVDKNHEECDIYCATDLRHLKTVPDCGSTWDDIDAFLGNLQQPEETLEAAEETLHAAVRAMSQSERAFNKFNAKIEQSIEELKQELGMYK
eukprot:CAMPEP_0114667928 /NCGR_PEP_ID=MMETSP0191-20121206/35445_1 /TAXON_ID=126664 /ORGANISM="Sorites sp." /LENGTH=93 /DNA_ID=CAMNT_0001919855 /DNA_START=619 /DNA_END=900 /DNA_ORIENTATION=+